jgi:hypothetical protein
MSVPKHLLTQAILANKITGAQLDALLTSGYLGTWKNLLKSRDLSIMLKNPTSLAALFASATAFGALLDLEGAELAGSDAATETISNTSAGILLIVTHTGYLDLWQNVPANKSRLQARINAGGSKLRRAIYTSSDSWIAPGTPIVGMAGSSVGGGGNGSYGSWDSGYARSGGGGAGGAVETKSATSGLPTTNQTITVGSAAAASSIGSFLTAAAGQNGTWGGGTATGGGSDTGTIYDTDLTNAIWQPNTASKKGGNGGGPWAYSGNADGIAGSAGLTGSGGAGGNQYGSYCTSAYEGTGIGSGGGSGATIYPSGASGAHGRHASGYGCGGGGGSGVNSSYSGGNGAPGLAVKHWIDG